MVGLLFVTMHSASGMQERTDIMPRVFEVTPTEMTNLLCEGAEGCDASDIMAAYSQGVMYLREGWSARDAKQTGILLHEFVHHLQFMAGRDFACAGEREAEAYETQLRFLETQGINADDEPGEYMAGPLKRMMIYQCGELF
jgi:hypothetical protein